MKVKTNVKAGGRKINNHNETLVRETAKTKGVKNTTKSEENQNKTAELSDKDLEQVAGGIILHGSSAPDEGPEESITFVYGKMGVKYF